MKLTAIILTITLLHVQAAGLSQTVTFSGNNILLEKVFTVIKQQTGYMFLYTADVIKGAKKVSLHVKEATLEEALNLALKDQPLSYHIANNTIIISRVKEPSENNQSRNNNLPPPGEIKGKVLNHKGEPLAGANVKVKGTTIAGVTNAEGSFELRGIQENATIEISYLGFETQVLKLSSGQTSISVQLKLVESELAAVSVSVYTGYQQIPKERATGSFVQVDNKLLNRGASYDVLGRLEGVASGLAFYRNSKTDQPTLNIRGRSTIYAELQPLIVVDNFPYDGDITNINPNTVESITILRDAAAASIYGVRSANGVIVITTKKGNSNTPPQVSFNTNVTIGARPDLNYFPLMSSADFIEAEKLFFSKGWYTTAENSLNKFPLTPVVDLLIKKRDGLIPATDADQQIEDLKQHNLRDEYDKYFFRNRVLLQNSLSVSGGGNNSRYFLTISYDKDRSSYANNGFNRYSINASHSFTPFKNLDINTSLLYTSMKLDNNNPGINDLISINARKYYPYAQLMDENGYALPVNYGFQSTYKALKENQGFLDWQYRPVDELNLADNTSQQNYNKVNIELRKTFSSHFNIELKYQYEKQLRRDNVLYSQETYFTRDLINKYYNPAVTLKYPVPLGGIFDQTVSELEGHTGRAQVNFNQKWQQHRVSAIGGFEVKQLEKQSNQSRLYGYNGETIASQVMDYVTKFQTNPAGTALVIPYPRTVTGTLDRYLSYYANASYTYNDRYVFSASGRLDNTNYFGIKSNQRIVPLWSMGVKWNVNREDFFKTDLFEQLALRATYGYNGNINKGQTAYTTVRYGNAAYTAASSATVINPPNPELRWERSNMFNAGVVFILKKNVLSGSIEYFSKKGTDIIGDAVMDPTTGVTSFRGNMANIKGQGVDVQLTGKIISNKFSWNATALFSRATDKLSNYTRTFNVANIINQGSGEVAGLMTPYNGYPVLAIYSFAWGGLDPITGDPLGVLNDLKTNKYTDIFNNTTYAEMVYNGPVNPPVIGAFRNDFHWNELSLSVNITYKFGHFFRRPNLDYYQFVNFWSGNKEFVNRWQKPGDEAITNVPSMPGQYPAQGNTRDLFYASSEIVVEKADHIRLQDIVVSYDFDKTKWRRLRCQNIHVYCNISNLGILWRANKYGIDPDAIPNTNAQLLPQARSVTLGAKIDF